jgi:rubrerythrin
VITKDELISQLRQLHNEEELAIPIYTKHLESTFFLSDIKPEARDEIKSMLLTLAMESEVHARMFEGLIKKVKESPRDVY